MGTLNEVKENVLLKEMKKLSRYTMCDSDLCPKNVRLIQFLFQCDCTKIIQQNKNATLVFFDLEKSFDRD